MKTSFTVTIEISNMAENVFTHDLDLDVEATKELELRIHNAIMLWVKQYLTEESLSEALVNNYVIGMEEPLPMIENYEALRNYCNLKITFTNNETKEEEVLCNLTEYTPIDEESPFEPPRLVDEQRERERLAQAAAGDVEIGTPIPEMELDDNEELSELKEEEDEDANTDDIEEEDEDSSKV